MASFFVRSRPDVLKLVCPASADATLANITFTLSGTR